MPAVRFAIAYTVKDESRLLPSAIQYHIAAGCSRIYVFFDGTTDGLDKRLAEDRLIAARNSVAPGEMNDAPEWLIRILPWWQTDMDVRKRANTYYASQWAASEGIDWLISLDPDELILMSRDEPINEDHVSKHLCKVPGNVDQILLPNLESVPTSADCADPFVDCVYFLNRFPLTETLWRYSRALLGRLLRAPALVAWYDYFFYQVRFAGALPRKLREPRNHRMIPAGYFLGYSSYKAFIRLSVASQFNFATHCWLPAKRAPHNLRMGNVLHFDMLDASYLAAKFRQRQEGILLKVFYLRYRLALLARNSTDEEIRDFFERYIAVRDPKRIELLKKKRILLEICTVSNLLRRVRGEVSEP